jgi:surface carbohydrate biosynthesis protein
MINENKWLIFPLEIVERELNGKLLICQEAISRGWSCILGTEHEIIKALDHFPQGIFFLKGALLHELPYLRTLKKKGHKIICLDEEGLVQNSLEYLISTRSAPETVQELDATLFWGTAQCDAFKAIYPAHQDRFFVTSNPRIDIWDKRKYHDLCAESVAEIKARYGEYFIIPTSFGFYNHAMGKDGAMEIYKVGKFVTEDSVSFFEEYEEYAKNIYYGFIELIDPLSKAFPEISIIVRPHPSENREPWDRLAENYKNVHVVFEGSVTPWLLGATAVLHCGSTTAVEAHLMGRPVISYCRGKDDLRYRLEVPAKVSINVTKQEEVLDLLSHILNGEDINAAHPEVAAGRVWLKEWSDNIGTYDSSARIMDVLEKLDVKKTKYIPTKIQARQKLNIATIKSFVWKCLMPLGAIPIIKDILPFRIKFGIKTQSYNKKKVRNINPQEVERFLSKLEYINSGPKISMQILAKNVIALTAAKD